MVPGIKACLAIGAGTLLCYGVAVEKSAGVLGNEPDLGDQRARREAVWPLALDTHRAAGRASQPGQPPEQGGLARTVPSHDRDDFAGAEFEA